MTAVDDQTLGLQELAWLDQMIVCAYGTDAPFPVTKVLVVMKVGQPNRVFLNDDVPGQLTIEVRDVGKRAEGDIITIDDVVAAHEYEPPAELGDAAYVLGVLTSKGWTVFHDFTYNAGQIAAHIEAADEFVDGARVELEAGRLRTWAELAFGAAELLAKAELLGFPDAAFAESKRHASREARLHEWASLENIDPAFPKTLSRLIKLRHRSRYLEGNGAAVSLNDADEMQATLELFLRHVIDCASARASGRGLRKMVKMRAWREIAVGTFVSWGVDTGLGQRSKQVAS